MPPLEELDLYKVLGVSRDATSDEIRTAWKRLAKQHHPDKHSKTNGEAAAQAAEHFKAVAFAHSVLSDPEKRRRYDMYGPEDLDLEDFDEFTAPVDPHGVGTVHKAVLSMLSRTGLEMRTAVQQQVLGIRDADAEKAPPLLFGSVHHDKVEKQAMRLYALTLTKEQISKGLLVSVYSPAGSKFKVVLFEKRMPDSMEWQLVAQEDSSKIGKDRLQTAGLFFMPFDTYQVGASLVEDPEEADELEVLLFSKLRGMKRRDNMVLRPGKYVVAVYGDNWFHRSVYVLKLLGLRDSEKAAQGVRDAETRLLQHKRVVQELEQRYRKAQEKLASSPFGYSMHQKAPQTPAQVMVVEALDKEYDMLHVEAEAARDRLEDLLEHRAAAYRQLLQTAAMRPTTTAHTRGDSVPDVMQQEGSTASHPHCDSASSSPRSGGRRRSSIGKKLLSAVLLSRKPSNPNSMAGPCNWPLIAC